MWQEIRSHDRKHIELVHLTQFSFLEEDFLSLFFVSVCLSCLFLEMHQFDYNASICISVRLDVFFKCSISLTSCRFFTVNINLGSAQSNKFWCATYAWAHWCESAGYAPWPPLFSHQRLRLWAVYQNIVSQQVRHTHMDTSLWFLPNCTHTAQTCAGTSPLCLRWDKHCFYLLGAFTWIVYEYYNLIKFCFITCRVQNPEFVYFPLLRCS